MWVVGILAGLVTIWSGFLGWEITPVIQALLFSLVLIGLVWVPVQRIAVLLNEREKAVSQVERQVSEREAWLRGQLEKGRRLRYERSLAYKTKREDGRSGWISAYVEWVKLTATGIESRFGSNESLMFKDVKGFTVTLDEIVEPHYNGCIETALPAQLESLQELFERCPTSPFPQTEAPTPSEKP